MFFALFFIHFFFLFLYLFQTQKWQRRRSKTIPSEVLFRIVCSKLFHVHNFQFESIFPVVFISTFFYDFDLLYQLCILLLWLPVRRLLFLILKINDQLFAFHFGLENCGTNNWKILEEKKNHSQANTHSFTMILKSNHMQ